MRELTYEQALSEGLVQAMEKDGSVFTMGVGVDDPKGIFGTTLGAHRKFGDARVFDIPLSEPALTGAAIGAALHGMRPVMVHARNDFLLVTMDQIANTAAKWPYASGGAHVPIVIRAIIGRGWGQGAQHAQSLQATFAHIPGLKVVMPATPYDAKGLLTASIREDCPVIFIDHRRLYDRKGAVPEEYYEVPLGRAVVRRLGDDITIVGDSIMAEDALEAAVKLDGRGISAEVIDLRTVSPIDDELIYNSVKKTHRLIVADTSWRSFGIASEVISRVTQNCFEYLHSAPRLIASPDVPSPVSSPLEKLFYPGAEEITAAALELVRGKAAAGAAEKSDKLIDEDFHGPF
jgi:acetoin:2,6-dichlorophenolindophenol oxidoreductase subunit beta